ncbi:uncharacterized protein THITE_2119612 [Thermothielavioides terrestris NRRL 8126]|uniref:Zinc finger PHD-type domain-containing protein n=1 Tax=Thermothielavioides terrestris (strain ATCC 38088 / NRRL 8126) TaxID=578455 RepID=G2RC11_THETT|nr:uncharacterized protein THITE_2119612 [Thermothielavioides terrestris NRRL 8126]AEO69332.1 hypothetical protein THITE_2119612 [Thermothielavioides terrestris NRRL 8126]
MSVDQPGASFGDPNAQPPTPKRTPITAVLPSPIFETPKHNQGRFDESSGWTPRFAEEYSVFNATPGNLRGSQIPFPDFGPPTPYSAQKRSSLADGIGADVAVHVNELSSKPSLQLPPVEPSKILRSSPNPLQSPAFDRSGAARQPPGSSEESAEKTRRGTIVAESQGQAATPPPSARKGERKLAPKLDPTTMQNDQDFAQQAHFMASAQQQGMGNFATAQGDMFGYPLSAPASAPAYGDQRSFWDADPSLAGMELDFSAGGGGVFHPQTSLQGTGPVDWARTNQMLPTQGGLAGQADGHGTAGDQSSLVAQSPLSMLVTSAADHSMFAASYPTSIEDPFGITDSSGGVNPGLLFSRPQTASLDATTFEPSVPGQNPSGAAAVQVSQTDNGGLSATKVPGPNELRRSASAKEATPKKHDRASASSPLKESGRPGLSRSFSENRGKKVVGRSSLPPLAPRPRSQLVSNAGVNANKPVISQPQRPSGRSSPSKSQHHHRLSSLSSIPEASGPQLRTQATFSIDANGRARVETTVVVVNEPPPSAHKRHSAYAVAPRRHWELSDEDDSSSTDDEPIIIPSRNTSFALPDPVKPTTIHPFHSSQRSMSERSTTSYTSFQGASQEGGDSDGETVVDDLTPTRKASGNALSELRKLRDSRQKQSSSSKSKRFVSSSHHPLNHPATSPTTLSESSLPTPTTDGRTRGIRCVCNRAEAGPNDLLVPCESCEMYVHGRCVNITQRTMPSIYICAFCANTPNARGGRHRDNERMSGAVGPPGSTSSPLAHKSLKSFR